MMIPYLIFACLAIAFCLVLLYTKSAQTNKLIKQCSADTATITALLNAQQSFQQTQREQFDAHQLKSLSILQESLQKGMTDVRDQVYGMLSRQSETLSERLNQLTKSTEKKLADISDAVDKRLSSSFEKTQNTFLDVVKRLSIIDAAQQKITELSSNVVSLQEILSDKQSRGAFGEVQLSALIRNMIPETHFELQHTLSNGKRVDCFLRLPEPTGNVAVDAKFPLESYQKMNSEQAEKTDKAQFQLDVKKHINDIHDKYIIAGETADGAVMFLPSEAIFAEIHAHFPSLISFAHQKRVWLVSPTTMMAILTTARAVLKDADTRKQVHIIQEHLVALGKDFTRFQTRMDKLATHIDQAQKDVEQVHASSRKISSRFNKIERVDLLEE